MNLALITIRNEMKSMYCEELEGIFSGYLNLISYSLEVDLKYLNNIDKLKEAEVIVITHPQLFANIKNIISPKAKIIYLEYAFLKNKVEALKELSPNTKALICFNYYAVSVRAAAVIYEMGFTNLDISIFNPENSYLNQNYDVAIVGENSAIVPESIGKILSLGRRKISIKTLLNIANTTNILNDSLENLIHQYSLDLATPNNFINNIFTDQNHSKIQLQAIMDYIDYSIITIDANFNILNYNENIKDIFQINNPILQKNIKDINELKPLIKYIKSGEMENTLVELNDNKNITLTIRKIYNMAIMNNSYLILIRDVTEIMMLEGTLKKKVEKKGHVTKHNFSNIRGISISIKECIEKAKKISKIDGTILILGESGTGKELFAHSIHNESNRKNFPFISINCAALPPTLLESELFGYSDGTFTGARKGGKKGLFELANNGTLLLDEIGDMSLEVQAKMLRVLEEKEFMRLGSGEMISVNVRIIAVTNKDLQKLIKDGLFRLDLFYRLNTLMLQIPPLRERKEDIHFLLTEFLKSNGNFQMPIDDNVVDFLINHPWEGNVRELKSCVNYMKNIADNRITMKSLPDYMKEDAYYKNESPLDDFHIMSMEDKEIINSILKIIAYIGGGRRTLIKELRIQFPKLSEYKLRQLLDTLKKTGYIEIMPGPIGLTLKSKGIEYLETSVKNT